MRKHIKKSVHQAWLRFAMVFAFVCMHVFVQAQPPVKKYTISHGGMEIVLGKNISTTELNDFIKQYDLADLSLDKMLRNNVKDSLEKMGWKVEVNNNEILAISKPLYSSENFSDPSVRFRITGTGNFSADNNPVPMNNQVFGQNIFRSRKIFSIKDSVVTFILRKYNTAKNVMLAGNFTNWQTGAIPMQQTDSGWVLPVKMAPGKYTYKFIVDGNWLVDTDNSNVENDGEGNTNSVFYVTNSTFTLNGFLNAKKVFVAGSFNNWNEKELRLMKIDDGWQLPIFLTTGSYTYRFIVDGKWIIDPANPNKVPNEFNDFNSVVNVGKPTTFILEGLTDAKKVFLSGSFNQWHNYDLPMIKTPTGWQINYVLGPGNYEYKFFVDNQWVDAEGNEIDKNEHGSVLVIEPNYTFTLKNYPNAKTVFLSGDFNGWSPNAFRMKKVGNDWELITHLSPGKHVYKFVVDGEWIKDPGNKLWEENEFNTGNSVLWLKEPE